MLYYLLFEKLRQFFSPFNVFKYITFRAAYATITALLICLVLGPFVIRKLRSMNVGQKIREEIKDTHSHKAGTPTMGGLLILASLIISTVLWARLDNPLVIVVLFSVIWFGAIGFVDDYTKLVQGAAGVRGWYKLAAEALGAFLEPVTRRLPEKRLRLVGELAVQGILAAQSPLVDAVLDLALVAWGTGPGGADQKAIVLGHATVDFAQHRFVDQRLGDRRFEVVGDNPLRHTAPALKSSTVESNPGRYFLIKDQLGVLMTAVAKGSHERVGSTQTVALWIE